jgi:hypothetical protein
VFGDEGETEYADQDRSQLNTKVSEGRDHCYAETSAERWRGIPGHPFEQGFDVGLWPERPRRPLR